MSEYKIIYILTDDNGANNIELPILLELGTTFQHEFGTYQVTGEDFDSRRGTLNILCKRISTLTSLKIA